MKLAKRFLLCVAFACSLLFVSSSRPADSPYVVDNQLVRVISATDMPHAKGARHHHEFNRVMIYLDGGDLEITYDDGHKDEQHWKAGDVAWSLAGPYHTSENVGPRPVHIIEIELKEPGPVVSPVRKTELDPIAIDPEHNTLLLENDQVRVIKSWREPGGAEKMHQHVGRGRVTVFLTDADTNVKLADGTTNALHAKAGDVRWSDGPVTHTSRNTGSSRLEVVVVEVK